MSFSGVQAMLAIALRMELPGRTVRLVEGGVVEWNGEEYTADDVAFGTVEDFENYSSGSADEAPAYEFTMHPPSSASAAAISDPTFQKSPCTLAILSVDKDTGTVLTQKTIFSGLLSYTNIEGGLRRRLVKIGKSTHLDLFFNTDKGNRISPAFHRMIHPGETGLDMMSGTAIKVPWGDQGPQPKIRGYGSSNGTVSGGGLAGGGSFFGAGRINLR